MPDRELPAEQKSEKTVSDPALEAGSAEAAGVSEAASCGAERQEGPELQAPSAMADAGGGPGLRKWRRSFAAVLVLVLGIAVFWGGWFWQFCRQPVGPGTEVTVLIPPGSGVRRIGALLADKGLVPDDIRYLVWLRLSGLSGRLKAGEYSFAPGMTAPQVLRKIARGEVLRHPVTIVEGLRLEQIAAVFAGGGWVDAQEFLRLCHDPAFLKSERVQAKSLEGYLFPDTYFMERGITEAQLLHRMVQRFRQVWGELPEAAAGQAGMSPHDTLILASIVEKESGRAAERPLIARVFLNRLGQGMPLQSDPTVIYGLGAAYTGKLRKADLRSPSSHNTYMLKGLPPGPICSPGRAALAAVLAPADSEALYFVSRNDGSHVFSNTLAEHNRAVQRYQKQGRRPSEQGGGVADGTPANTMSSDPEGGAEERHMTAEGPTQGEGRAAGDTEKGPATWPGKKADKPGKGKQVQGSGPDAPDGFAD